MTIEEVVAAIRPADRAAMAQAEKQWSNVGKPLGSLGLLEDMVVRMAGMCGTADFSIAHKTVVPFCADNGVVAEGVTQTGQEVTAAVAGNMARRASSVCRSCAKLASMSWESSSAVARRHCFSASSTRRDLRGSGWVRFSFSLATIETKASSGALRDMKTLTLLTVDAV